MKIVTIIDDGTGTNNFDMLVDEEWVSSTLHLNNNVDIIVDVLTNLSPEIPFQLERYQTYEEYARNNEDKE